MELRHHDVIPPMTPRGLLGYEARRLREHAGLSLSQVASIAKCDKTYLSRVERAEKFPSEVFIAAVDAALGGSGLLNRLWEAAYNSTFADYVRRFMELEARATKMHKYMVQTVPGLWQTEEYARAMISAALPSSPEGQVDELVVARLARQRLLAKAAPPLFWAVLDEAVLRRRTGGASVMAAQLARIVELAGHPEVVLQVLPFSAGAHASPGSSLTLLSFAQDSDVAYIESSHSGELVEARDEVAEYSLRYDLIRAKALPPDESLDLVQAVMEEYQRCL